MIFSVFIYVKEKKQKFSGYWTQTEPPAKVEKKDTDIVSFHFISGFSVLQIPCPERRATNLFLIIYAKC